VVKSVVGMSSQNKLKRKECDPCRDQGREKAGLQSTNPQAEVGGWVEQAKHLPRALTYYEGHLSKRSNIWN
jgi:hypothetical protein